MRIRELLAERQMPERKRSVMSYSKHYPSMPSSDPYQVYRFGINMANHAMHHREGPAAQHAVIVAYTPEEEEIIAAAERQSGHRGLSLADRGSTEPKTTATQSPVAKFKPNRFGV